MKSHTLPASSDQLDSSGSAPSMTKRNHRAAFGSLAVAFATTLAIGATAPPPANAASGTLNFCPYLPYLAKGSSQINPDPYSWTLYQVDDAGHNLVRQQGRDRGCHTVSLDVNATYRVEVQGDCFLNPAAQFKLKGMSDAILIPDDPTPVQLRVNAGWVDC